MTTQKSLLVSFDRARKIYFRLTNYWMGVNNVSRLRQYSRCLRSLPRVRMLPNLILLFYIYRYKIKGKGILRVIKKSISVPKLLNETKNTSFCSVDRERSNVRKINEVGGTAALIWNESLLVLVYLFIFFLLVSMCSILWEPLVALRGCS